MSSNPSTAELESLREENRRLSKAVRRADREVRQWKRTAQTSEMMSELSKRATLRTHGELAGTIEELEQAKVRAEQASDSKSRFLATMSHEIRTPMNGVLGTLELLLRTPLEGDQHDLARISYESSRALLQVINDILDYSKLEAGALQLESLPVDAHELVQRALETMRSAAQQRTIALESNIGPNVVRRFSGDAVRLRQILLNLIGNALKFTREGIVSVSVRAPSSQRLRFEVRDTGIGIPEDRLSSIFEVFTQADERVTRRFGGTGLGLTISRSLVEMMGGGIGVESELGIGSTFWFEIPCVSVAAAVDDATGDLEEAHADDFVPAFRRALVVDDNAVNRLIAERMLKNLGLEVESVGGGGDAIVHASATDYDVIFMDCSMPDVDGYQATRAIRRLPQPFCDVPIVAMTAFVGEDAKSTCAESGMTDYLSKPMTQKDVRRVLGRLTAEVP